MDSKLQSNGGAQCDGAVRSMKCSASELFEQQFSKPRTPRSPEYKAGVLAHMKYRMKESDDCKCPYAEGTASADAWWSGVTESWLILAANNADARRPNVEVRQAAGRQPEKEHNARK